MVPRQLRRAVLVAALVAICMPATGGGAASPEMEAPAERRTPSLTVLSSDADKVTGGDALVEVLVPRSGARHLALSLNGTDVTPALTEIEPRRFVGVVQGLSEGENLLVASTHGPTAAMLPRSDSELVTNHRLAGPVFSGPHQQPFYCETAAAGLGEALDADCTAPTQVVYAYRTTAGQFAPLADPAARPADLATVTVGGVAVPYIVRLERGIINRGLYEFAALYDGADPAPGRAEQGWNTKLVMTFGGGCNVGYHMGDETAGVLNNVALSRGYAVASNSLLVNETNCSPVIAAETAMMTKERVAEIYGPITHTIGMGGSGGAIMQHTITHAYPGILDGLLPSASFPDAFTNSAPADCALLLGYLATPAGSLLTPAQRQAIGGHRTFGSCQSWALSFANRIDAQAACPDIIPDETIWDPVTNPTGVRCNLTEHVRTQLGVDEDGFAPALYSNDGVQYGLRALQDGTLGVDAFLDLNAGIGGYDRNGRPQAERSLPDPRAIARVVETGLAAAGTGGLAYTPTIDLRSYTDAFPDIHTSYWSVAMHERLVGDGVDPRIHVRWITAPGVSRQAEALDAMEAWLSAIDADHRRGTPAEVAVRNRPPAASDGCWTSATASKISDIEACYAGPFPIAADPRIVAGGPVAGDVVCQTAPPEPEDYEVTLSSEQWARLEAIFPRGVCDWTLPGLAADAEFAGPWQSYGSTP
jgi:Tannase-like family of unknown function (DUF6351)